MRNARALHIGGDVGDGQDRNQEGKRNEGGGAKHEVKSATGIQERDHRHRKSGNHEGEKVTHGKDAAAPGVGGVARDDQVVDGDLAVDAMVKASANSTITPLA
jgi:hypothetical protein